MRIKVQRGPSLRTALYELCVDIAKVQEGVRNVQANEPDAPQILERRLWRLEQAFAELIEKHAAT